MLARVGLPLGGPVTARHPGAFEPGQRVATAGAEFYRARGAPVSGAERDSGPLPLRCDQLALDQAFGDLDGVERGALAQIVGDDPHRQSILDGRVLADTADVGRVLARRLVGG